MGWLTDRRLLTAALAVWGTVALVGVVLGPSIGHDEAAFALAARGEAPPGLWLYRPDGTIAIARLGLLLGNEPWQLRIASALLGLLAIVAAYAVGRAASSPRTGAWAAAVLAGAHPMALRSAELLSDLPAMAGVLGGIAVLVAELGRADGPRWRIVLAAPMFAGAFYVRYGAAPVVALAIALALVMWWRSVARRPVRVLAMVAVLALLLIPHLQRSLGATGKLLGILELSSGVPRRAYIGEGLVTYLTSNPFLYYGFLSAPVMVAAIVGVAQLRRKAAWYLVLVALAQMTVLGLKSHGQPRYVFVAVALLVVVGVDVLAHHRLARPRVAFALVAASWLGIAITAPVYYRRIDDARTPLIEAAHTIRAASAGRPCVIVALIVPQLMWHSGCVVLMSELVAEPLPAEADRYAASFTAWPFDVDRLLASQHLRAVPLPAGDPRARVWRLVAPDELSEPPRTSQEPGEGRSPR